jgi:hypothetical protein
MMQEFLNADCNFEYVGCELNKEYYITAKKRLKLFRSSGELF